MWEGRRGGERGNCEISKQSHQSSHHECNSGGSGNETGLLKCFSGGWKKRPSKSVWYRKCTFKAP